MAIDRQEGYARFLCSEPLDRLLPMNEITAVCLAVCLATLMVAYGRAAAGGSVDKLAGAFGLLGSTLLLAALTVMTIDVLVKPSALTGSQLSAGVRPSAKDAMLEILSIPAISAATLLCKAACRVGVRATQLVVGAWSAQSRPPLTVRDLLGKRFFWL